MFQKITDQNSQFLLNQKFRQLIEKCWSANPSDRPTFDEIYNRLSRNTEETVYNVFDDEKNESEYYLDDVDADEIFAYVDKIDNNDDSPKIDLNRLIERMNQLERENIELKQKSHRIREEN